MVSFSNGALALLKIQAGQLRNLCRSLKYSFIVFHFDKETPLLPSRRIKNNKQTPLALHLYSPFSNSYTELLPSAQCSVPCSLWCFVSLSACTHAFVHLFVSAYLCVRVFVRVCSRVPGRMHLRESPRPCPCRVSGPRKELRSACSPSSPRLLCTGRTNTVSPSRPLRWAGRAVLQHQSDSPASHRAELLPHRPPRRSRSTGPCRAPSRSHRAPAEPPCETGVLSPPRALQRREEGRGICMLPSAGRQSAGDPRLAEAERGAGTVAGRSQSPRLGGADGLCRVSSVATVGGLSARGQSGMPREIHGSLGGAGAGAGAGPAAASLVDGRLCPRGELRGAPVLASGASTSSPNPSVSDVKAAVPRSSDAAGPAGWDVGFLSFPVTWLVIGSLICHSAPRWGAVTGHMQ